MNTNFPAAQSAPPLVNVPLPRDRLMDELALVVEELNAVTDHDERVVLIQQVERLRSELGIVPGGTRA